MSASRVVVLLEAAPQDRRVLEAAVQLAARLQAELVALLVENVELLHMAGLPFAREIGYPSAAPRGLDVSGMERSLKARAQEIQRRVASAVLGTPLQWSFRVTRGAVAVELYRAAAEADLVLAGLQRNAGRVAAICRGAAADAVLAEQSGGFEVVRLQGSETEDEFRRLLRDIALGRELAAS